MTIRSIVSYISRHRITILAAMLLLSGIIYIWTPRLVFYAQRVEGTSVNQQYWKSHPSAPAGQTMRLGVPTNITFARLGIDLAIQPGAYDSASQMWRLDRQHAFYIAPGTSPLRSSAVPLIYGHDIAGVFINLNGIAPGEVMTISNDKGQLLTFRYIQSYVVDPNEGNVLNTIPNDRNSVDVLTCTGPWFTQRHIMRFEFESGTAATERAS